MERGNRRLYRPRWRWGWGWYRGFCLRLSTKSTRLPEEHIPARPLALETYHSTAVLKGLCLCPTMGQMQPEGMRRLSSNGSKKQESCGLPVILWVGLRSSSLQPYDVLNEYLQCIKFQPPSGARVCSSSSLQPSYLPLANSVPPIILHSQQERKPLCAVLNILNSPGDTQTSGVHSSLVFAHFYPSF